MPKPTAEVMQPSHTISIIIGIALGTMLFPMIMIPLMGIGVVVAAIYLFIHDVLLPVFRHHGHTH